MKALVYTAPNTVVYRDEPEPPVEAGEVLVRIDAVGICGSDMHGYHGHDPRRVPPLILGHEAAGEVVEGRGVGRRVVLNPLVTCGACAYCTGGRSNLCPDRKLIGMSRPGAFAELIAIPEANLIPVPDGMTATQAALTEPCATSLHALVLATKAMARPLAEARALVIGGGSIGLLGALLLQHYGCRDYVLAESNRLRRETAMRAGVRSVLDPVTEVPDGESFDLVLDAVGGTATREAAIAAVRPGGVVAHVGLMEGSGGMDARKLTLSEVTFVGSYTYTRNDLEAAVRALAAGVLGPLDWLETRPLATGGTAFADLDHGRAAAPKIVLLPRA